MEDTAKIEAKQTLLVSIDDEVKPEKVKKNIMTELEVIGAFKKTSSLKEKASSVRISTDPFRNPDQKQSGTHVGDLQKNDSPSLAGLSAAKMAAKQFKKKTKKTALQEKAQKIAERLENQIKLSPSSIAKITGSLFSHEDEIPAVLRPAIEGLAKGLDSVDAQIELFKPTIEMLIYWETLTSALFITFGIFSTWLLTRLGFHFLWTFLILFVTAGTFKRNQERLRRKIHHDVKIVLCRKKLEDESEAVEWLNMFLEKFWLQYEPSLSESIAASVNFALEANKPAFLDDLRLSHFTLGSEAPRIEFVKSYPRTAEDFMMMDLALSFQPFDEDDLSKRQRALTNKRNSKIELVARIGKSVASIPIPILLTEIDFSGTLRAQFKFGTSFPHIEMMEFGFLERPKVDFILRPLKGMDLMDMPGLSSFLDDTINWALETNIVDPNTIKIPLAEWMNGAQEADPVIGVLAITIINGKSLKNTELTGKADPYAKILLGGTEMARTKVIDDELNPVWNETLYILIKKSHIEPSLPNQDELRIEIMDYNNLSKDRSMGKTQSIKLSEWMSLIDEENDEEEDDEEEDSTKDGQDVDTKGKKKSLEKKKAFVQLSNEQRDQLLNAWGHPLDDIGVVKKDLHDENKEKGNGGVVSLKISFYEVQPAAPLAAPAADAGNAANTNNIEEITEEDKSQQATQSGVLSITIHQGKDIPVPAKSCNAFVVCELNNGIEIGKTITRKKTNAPVWEQKIDVFILDVDTSRLKFILKDDKDTGSYTLGTISLKVANIIQKKEDDDWFAIIDGKGGKVRISFKFQQIIFDHGAAHAVSNPLGVIRIGVKEAKGLLNVEAFKKSDPYAVLKVEGHTIGKTHTIENSLDPVWNEMYYALVYSMNTKVHFEVFDYNNIRQDRKLGRCELALCDILERDTILSRVSGSSIQTRPDISRLEALSVLERDGLDIIRENSSAQVWCPLYLISDQVNAGTFPNDLRECIENKRAKQKGHLQFELDFFPALPDELIVHEKAEENLSTAVEEGNESEKAPVESNSNEDEKKIVKLEKKSSGLLRSNATLIKRELINDSLKSHPTGVLRFKLHEARKLSKVANVYARIRIAGETDYIDTQVLKKTNEPIWNETHDIFVKHVFTNVLEITIYDAQQSKDSDDEILCTFNVKNINNKIGKAYEWIDAPLKANDDVKEGICCSFGYIPVDLTLDQAELSDNSGTLQVDIIKAKNLESVDSNGLSDPYCVVLLNNARVAKTKVHKKTLNPVFNESFNIKIESRHRSNIVIEVRDYNMLQKSTVIATLTIPMSKVPPNSIIEDDFDLEGTVRGTLSLRLTFSTKVSSKNNSPLLAKAKTLLKSESKSEANSIIEDEEKSREPGSQDAVMSRHSSHILSRGNTLLSLTDVRPKSSGITGELSITIECAKNLKSVDSNGLSDPYVKVVHNYHGKVRTIHKTAVVKKTLNPKFETKKEIFKVHFPPHQIRFIIKDHNTFGDSKDMGEAVLDIAKLVGDNSLDVLEFPIDAWLPITMGGSGELHIYGKVTLGAHSGSHSRKTSEVYSIASVASTENSIFASVSGASEKKKPMSAVKEVFEDAQ